ncbi:MAG: dihydroorotate dehydrogenase B catalytic subunit [Candidatus Fischerbacteria bacterium RBG_13_37_8]|uniref:Dihydroorotate dehydrogenase n=1 Tax=Candidatus Fischerbacteria bacterium RBG_13_37_8 TaxID=1817863 RepID=A0A1F5VKW2_9BACT|nr:MAG: dihydroorotate dehydrogenase B catalytic subunit [Candidatus Fischerbacteria bacterium RBG_13_37_8]
MAIDLSVKIGNVTLKNPIMPASGTFGYGLEFAPFYNLSELGAIVTKSLSWQPKAGSLPPRIAEVEGGMINAIGLENVGIQHFLKELLPELKKYDTVVIVSIFGSSIEEFLNIIDVINTTGQVDIIELNISCPNVRKGGILFGTNPRFTYDLIKEIKKYATIPIMTKLTPNDCNIAEIAKAAEDAGSDALSLINTLLALSIDISKKKPRTGFGFGGLSGPCIKPVALRMVYYVANTVSIPVVGMGGISSMNDIIEFIIAGATAVQVGTQNFIDPLICSKLVKQLTQYFIDHSINSLEQLRNSLSPRPTLLKTGNQSE